MVMEKLDESFRFITKFAVLNLLWIISILLGAGILGFFPGTAALFSTARRWVRNGHDGNIARPFWQVYKENFFKANFYGWMLLMFGMLLFVNFQIIQASSEVIPIFVVISYIMIVAVYLLILVMILPVALHFEGGFTVTMKRTFHFIFGRFHIALLSVVLMWAGVYLSLAFPALIVFFSGSLLAYMLMWFFNTSLEKLEEKAITLNTINSEG